MNYDDGTSIPVAGALAPQRAVDQAGREAAQGVSREAGQIDACHRTKRLGLLAILRFMGPAFVVSVAYMDPGNFGTNITAGSAFNYSLLWVLLWSNLFAVFLQTLSAKLGIATGADLPAICRREFSRPANWILWTSGTLAAIATNLAEFLGGALGFYLLFGVPPLWGAVLTGIIAYGILELSKYGQEHVELAISGLVSVISLCFVIEIFLVDPSWPSIALHTLVPSLDRDSLFVAVGMLGATVMPHVIYLHSRLVLSRRNGEYTDREHLTLEKIDVFVAMNIAFVINAAMVVVSAATFHSRGLLVDSIEVAHQTLTPLLGRLSGVAFGTALLASGLSSSAVGTYAGQVIVEGFVNLRMPLWLRRAITIVPAVAIIAIGLNPVSVLVTSQVILSFALPAAIVPLLILTGRRGVMGQFVNDRRTSVAGWLVCTLIIMLNAALLWSTLAG